VLNEQSNAYHRPSIAQSALAAQRAAAEAEQLAWDEETK
jgi:hypothetical protein